MSTKGEPLESLIVLTIGVEPFIVWHDFSYWLLQQKAERTRGVEQTYTGIGLSHFNLLLPHDGERRRKRRGEEIYHTASPT